MDLFLVWSYTYYVILLKGGQRIMTLNSSLPPPHPIEKGRPYRTTSLNFLNPAPEPTRFRHFTDADHVGSEPHVDAPRLGGIVDILERIHKDFL